MKFNIQYKNNKNKITNFIIEKKYIRKIIKKYDRFFIVHIPIQNILFPEKIFHGYTISEYSTGRTFFQDLTRVKKANEIIDNVYNARGKTFIEQKIKEYKILNTETIEKTKERKKPMQTIKKTIEPDKEFTIDLNNKSVSEIAYIIQSDWKKVNYAAKPYLDAMKSLNSIHDNYIMDSGKSIVSYFLANATTWKGNCARETKKHLKKLCNEKKPCLSA